MSLDRYPELDPGPGEVIDTELVVGDDVLVKAFALGPGADLAAHEHSESSNVFHILAGEVVVIQDDVEETIRPPGVVFHDRGVVHGARNDSDEPALLTATLAPFPG